MAASGVRAVVLFAIQLLLLTFALIGSGLLVRPAAAETAAGGRVDNATLEFQSQVSP